MTFGAQPEAGDEKTEAAPHEAETIGVGAAEGHDEFFLSPGSEQAVIQPTEGSAKQVIPALFACNQDALQFPTLLLAVFLVGFSICLHHREQTLPADANPFSFSLRKGNDPGGGFFRFEVIENDGQHVRVSDNNAMRLARHFFRQGKNAFFFMLGHFMAFIVKGTDRRCVRCCK